MRRLEIPADFTRQIDSKRAVIRDKSFTMTVPLDRSGSGKAPSREEKDVRSQANGDIFATNGESSKAKTTGWNSDLCHDRYSWMCRFASADVHCD